MEGTCRVVPCTMTTFRSGSPRESGPLLVSADPGCGKSVLSKFLVDEGLPRDPVICYFFFKDQDQNTINQALCALLHQLFSHKPPLIRHAMMPFAKNGPGLCNITSVLWAILEAAIRDPEAGPVVIVLDALDECMEADFKDLLWRSEGFLQELEGSRQGQIPAHQPTL